MDQLNRPSALTFLFPYGEDAQYNLKNKSETLIKTTSYNLNDVRLKIHIHYTIFNILPGCCFLNSKFKIINHVN